MRFSHSLLLFLLLVSGSLAAQNDVITLNNPSFEDIPRQGKEPRGWYDCGWSTESAPDVQPGLANSGDGFFKVQRPAKDGDTYVGLVVRDNDTWERIGQRLTTSLKAGQCYEFSIFMARSEVYESQSKVTGQLANYATPVKLRIWAGNAYCDRAELLAESSLVVNTRWLKFNFRFEPKQTHNFIMFEAYYRTPTLFPYNGNLLLDGSSDIVQVPCDETIPPPPADDDEPVADVTPPPPSTGSADPAPSTPVRTPEPARPAPPKKSEFQGEELAVGRSIRIQRLYFKADSTNFTRDSRTSLDELYEVMRDNNGLVVEVGGHTNTVPPPEYCDMLSSARAESVVEYLVRRGIESERLRAVGYGKRKPIIKDDLRNEAARKRNQRVEIKVLEMGG